MKQTCGDDDDDDADNDNDESDSHEYANRVDADDSWNAVHVFVHAYHLHHEYYHQQLQAPQKMNTMLLLMKMMTEHQDDVVDVVFVVRPRFLLPHSRAGLAFVLVHDLCLFHIQMCAAVSAVGDDEQEDDTCWLFSHLQAPQDHHEK